MNRHTHWLREDRLRTAIRRAVAHDPVRHVLPLSGSRSPGADLTIFVRQRLRRVNGVIAGIARQAFDEDDNPIPDLMSITVRGWSPSLHRVDEEWEIPTTGSPLAVTRDINRQVARQRARARMARREGLTKPMRPINPVHGPHPTARDLAHLTVGLIEGAVMAEELGEDDAIDMLALQLSALMVDRQPDHGELDGDRIVLHDGRPRLVAEFDIDGATVAGDILTVHHAIPATIAAALPGRRIGELVATGHDELDGATIVEILEADEDHVALRYQDQAVRLDRHPALTDALARLPEPEDRTGPFENPWQTLAIALERSDDNLGEDDI